MARRYVTTAIDFPNAAPHMGHVMEKILADVVVRWFRLRGDDVRFHIGTDENGIKIQQTAEALGVTPKELVDQNAPLFKELFCTLGISFDYFIRTSDPISHWPTVIELWKKLQAAGALEKRTYTGLYCTGCERFVTAKDLVDGLCPDHKQKPEQVTEENWFFLLTQQEDAVKRLLDPNAGTYRIVPDWRGNETHTFLEQGLEDVSFSRSRKTLTWGVPVPDDPDQVMYVWCDNLTSYISSLGYFTAGEMKDWWDGAEVTHVIGKDIARFHAINWPAMLMAAGVKTPDRLLIHGFLTSEGQKMSKTLGNVVVPRDVIDRYGVDALRFYLSHEIPLGNDGDFSWKRFGELYDAFLRNGLGNLLNRVLVLLGREGGSIDIQLENSFVQEIGTHWKEYEAAMDAFELHRALEKALYLVGYGNGFMDSSKPWTLKGAEKIQTLSHLAEVLRHAALMLLPFIPETARRISKQLNVQYAEELTERSFVITDQLKSWRGGGTWKRVAEAEILFAPVE